MRRIEWVNLQAVEDDGKFSWYIEYYRGRRTKQPYANVYGNTRYKTKSSAIWAGKSFLWHNTPVNFRPECWNINQPKKQSKASNGN